MIRLMEKLNMVALRRRGTVPCLGHHKGVCFEMVVKKNNEGFPALVQTEVSHQSEVSGFL
jgi:hypothetical protein